LSSPKIITYVVIPDDTLRSLLLNKNKDEQIYGEAQSSQMTNCLFTLLSECMQLMPVFVSR